MTASQGASAPVVDAAGEPQPDDSSPGLARSVTSGAGWLSASKIGGQIAQFAAGIVLARLLTPTDFGLLASIYVITGFSVLFFDLGLGTALVQMRRPDRTDENTVFWINALGGVVFALLITAAGPLIADVFNEPQLSRLAPFAALPFMLSIGVVQAATFQRNLQMRKLALLEVSTSAIGIALGLAAALAGLGVYSLTVAPIAQALLTSAVVWKLSPWRPTGFIDRPALRRLWTFSGGQLGFNVVNYWGRNADNLLVGRYLGAADLGFYNRGYNLMLLPVQQVSQVLGRVMMPALSGIGNDLGRAARVYTRAVATVDALAVPILVGIAGTAPGLVPLLWGPRWDATVPLLQILCVAGIPQCALASAGWLFQSQNRTGTMFRVGVVSSSIGVGLMALGLHWGVRGVAVAVLLKSWGALVPELFMACRLVRLPVGVVLRRVAGVNLAGALMFAVVWLVPVVCGLARTNLLVLALQVVAGIVAYPLALRFSEAEAFDELRGGAAKVAARVMARRAVRP